MRSFVSHIMFFKYELFIFMYIQLFFSALLHYSSVSNTNRIIDTPTDIGNGTDDDQIIEES